MNISFLTEVAKIFGKNILAYTQTRQAIDLWCDMYFDRAPWLSENLKSLNIASSIASEVARLVCLKLKSKITPKQLSAKEIKEPNNPDESQPDEEQILEDNPINNEYQKFLEALKFNIELACAYGGIVFKPIMIDNELVVSVIPQNQFFPLTIQGNGKIIESILIETNLVDNNYYTLIEHRKFDAQKHSETIEYHVFVSKNQNTLGNEIDPKSTDVFDIKQEKIILNNLNFPLIEYFKMPFNNNIEINCPIGVSIYSKAVSLIKDADNQYSNYLWVYDASVPVLYADPVAIKHYINGHIPVLPKTQHRILKDFDKKDAFNIWNPELRDTSYANGLNTILRKIEFLCGLSYNTLSDADEKELTATEIVSSKQRSYGTINEIQKRLEKSLERIANIIAIFFNDTMQNYDISFDWEDSVIIDIEKQKTIFQQEISMGIKQPWEYRVAFEGETEEEAKLMTNFSEDNFEDEKE
jgi:A118 family predicted phage portal protein